MIPVPSLSDFGLSPTVGFLSPQPPLQKFSQSYYSKWDEIIVQLPHLISQKHIHHEVNNLPLLSTKYLSSDLEYHRAYVILAFLVHAYVWGASEEEGPFEAVPPQLSEPFLDVCDRLQMRPVLSYAGLCLWNWVSHGAQGASLELGQLYSLASFTGTRGEDAFYHVPVLIEAEGGHLVKLLLDAVIATETDEPDIVLNALKATTETLERMGQHLSKFYSILDAQKFYHELRPFLSGGNVMEEKGLPRGVVFQRSDGTEHSAKHAGGNAGQSSLFQFLDYILGVEHEAPEGSRETFFEEMRAYMPGQHRQFLEAVSKLPSLRSFVERNLDNGDLWEAFNGCIDRLRTWRGKHIAVVSKYLVQPARSAMNGDSGPSAGADTDVKDEELKGTGGSALIPFLRQSRDETLRISR